MKSTRRFLLAAGLLLWLCTVRVQAQDILFSLTKRSDVVVLHPLNKGVGPFELRDDRLSNDHLSTPTAWKYTGFKWQEGGQEGTFTLVKSDGGSEVRLQVHRLAERYQPPVGKRNNGVNEGEMEMTITGHGPVFDKLSRDILKSRFTDCWNGADLTLHGGVAGH